MISRASFSAKQDEKIEKAKEYDDSGIKTHRVSEELIGAPLLNSKMNIEMKNHDKP